MSDDTPLMPSNQLPEDVREQMIRVISQAGTLHGTGTTTHMEVSALPEVFADAVLDAVAPLIIEWATEQAALIVEDSRRQLTEAMSTAVLAEDARAAAHGVEQVLTRIASRIRAQFADETGGQ